MANRFLRSGAEWAYGALLPARQAGLLTATMGAGTSLKGAGRRAPQAHSHPGTRSCSLRVSDPARRRGGNFHGISM